MTNIKSKAAALERIKQYITLLHLKRIYVKIP